MLAAALVLAIVALVLAVLALVVAVTSYADARAVVASPPPRAPRPAPRESARLDDDGRPLPPGPAAFVVNPTRVSDLAELEALARSVSSELGLPDPIVLTTTVEDPGVGQAREALARGASVVVVAGGDGTVRAVATAMAGSDVPMALLPLGTGNLLARNLDIPVGELHPLVTAALSGPERVIDVGWMRLVPPREPGSGEPGGGEPDGDGRGGDVVGNEGASHEHLFLVMAGTGFDARMVAGADDGLKRRVGWLAYFVVGARHLYARRTRLAMRIGNGQWQSFRLRTLLFANCGRLPAGLVLLPAAEIDDGYLDIAAIDTRGGILGWVSLFWRVVWQGLGFRGRRGPDISQIRFWRGRTVGVRLEQPEQVQVDGDLVGEAVELRVRVQAGALRVRVRR